MVEHLSVGSSDWGGCIPGVVVEAFLRSEYKSVESFMALANDLSSLGKTRCLTVPNQDMSMRIDLGNHMPGMFHGQVLSGWSSF